MGDPDRRDRASRKVLVLVRHAKSSWDDPSLPDHDRPLAPRGRKALRRMREHAEALGIEPDVVLCSSSRRTRETLAGIRSVLGPDVRVELEAGLYGASADEMLERLARIGDDVASVVVVAHNPGVADLVERLAGDAACPAAVPTGAVAVLSFDGSWSQLADADVDLDSFWQPRRPRP